MFDGLERIDYGSEGAHNFGAGFRQAVAIVERLQRLILDHQDLAALQRVQIVV